MVRVAHWYAVLLLVLLCFTSVRATPTSSGAESDLDAFLRDAYEKEMWRRSKHPAQGGQSTPAPSKGRKVRDIRCGLTYGECSIIWGDES